MLLQMSHNPYMTVCTPYTNDTFKTASVYDVDSASRPTFQLVGSPIMYNGNTLPNSPKYTSQ